MNSWPHSSCRGGKEENEKKFGKKDEFEFGGKEKSFGRVCQFLLSLAIDLFAQHGIVATRTNERHLRFVSK